MDTHFDNMPSLGEIEAAADLDNDGMYQQPSVSAGNAAAHSPQTEQAADAGVDIFNALTWYLQDYPKKIKPPVPPQKKYPKTPPVPPGKVGSKNPQQAAAPHPKKDHGLAIFLAVVVGLLILCAIVWYLEVYAQNSQAENNLADVTSVTELSEQPFDEAEAFDNQAATETDDSSIRIEYTTNNTPAEEYEDFAHFIGDFPDSGGSSRFEFTPQYDGNYRIWSEGETDVYLYVYDSEDVENPLYELDDNNGSINFDDVYYLDSEVTYILDFYPYGEDYGTSELFLEYAD